MFKWFAKDPYRVHAMQLYQSLVARARQPIFYAALGVPDTLDGRFEMITLHVFGALQRLDDAHASQALFDAMFRDMEANLREMGVGDLSVPKKMKFMMRAFNGRCHSYAVALRDGDRPVLIDALRRNVYGTVDHPDPACIDRLAEYFQGYMEQEDEAHTEARMVV